MDAYRQQQIIALRDTYVTLSVDEIVAKNFDVTGRGGDVGSKEETEHFILGMIERDEIRATLSQDFSTEQTIVHFHTNPIQEATNLHALEVQIKRTIALSSQVKYMDRKLGLSKEYLQYSIKAISGKPGGGGAISLLNSMGSDADVMDFDYGTGMQWGPSDELNTGTDVEILDQEP